MPNYKTRIVNRTAWNGKHLRKLCIAVLRHYGASKAHTIYIEYHRLNEYHGRASVNGCWVWMFVPRPDAALVKRYRIEGRWRDRRIPRTMLFDSHVFAQVLEHELGHNYGLRHEDMVKWWTLPCDYAQGIEVEAVKPQERPVVDITEVRYARARANLKAAVTRHKRATTLLKKWQQKVKYYEGKVSVPS